MPLKSPHLWIVATSLGNPGDFSQRARGILANSDLVLAEDTRRAAKLFKEYDIPYKRLISFFEHNEQDRLPAIMDTLAAGANIALITDAGTPLLADPGYRLVRACRKAKIPVSPVPGPSAPIAALSAAGIPPIPFTFLGFLPRDTSGRNKIFAQYRNWQGTLIFFERKDRLQESLVIAANMLGKREVAICRELTKEHEEFIFAQLDSLPSICNELLGEITVIIGPPEEAAKTSEIEVINVYRAEVETGLGPKQAAANTAAKCTGWTAREIYKLIHNKLKNDK